MENKGFTVKCNRCGKETVINGGENFTVGRFKFNNNNIDIEVFDTG